MQLADDAAGEGGEDPVHAAMIAGRPTVRRLQGRPIGARRHAIRRCGQNGLVQLLGLIRFIAIAGDDILAWEACERFEARLPAIGADPIHREDLQMMVLFDDAATALSTLAEALDEGERLGFALAAGLVQGIRSRATVASSLSGFTEGTIETLFEITSCALPQEVAISPKLSSIIRLAAPRHADRFEPSRARRPDSRIREPLVMRPATRNSPAGLPGRS